MAVPNISNVSPFMGTSIGGEVVKISGTGFAENVSVLFGEVPAEVIVVRKERGLTAADVRTPAHEPSIVAVTVTNEDYTGVPVPGERVTLPDAYEFRRSELAAESDLTRLVRTLLRMLRAQLPGNTGITVSVDYDDTTRDGLDVVAISSLPSVVLSGPGISENRFNSTNEPKHIPVFSDFGPDVVRHGPSFTVDLNFTITVASDRTIELLNLIAAVATFFSRNLWLEMDRDPADPGLGSVKWEMASTGEFRTHLSEGGDVRAFTTGFVIRGFDMDEGVRTGLTRPVEDTGISINQITDGGLP